MSLDYNYEKVQDADSFMWDEKERMRPEIESLIYYTSFVGVGELKTADDAERLWERALIFNGALYNDKPAFTQEDCLKMIGLTTNSSNMSDSAFWKDLRFRSEKLRERRKEMAKATAE